MLIVNLIFCSLRILRLTMRTFLILLLTTCYLQISAQDALRQKHFNTKKNLAIEGYDPVSYFDNMPSEGKPEIKITHKGVVYQFANQINLNKFKTTPDKYEPAYGGWCAFAMGESGEKVKVDPETYKIIEGKLYLFYNFWGNNTLSDWNQQEKKLKPQQILIGIKFLNNRSSSIWKTRMVVIRLCFF